MTFTFSLETDDFLTFQLYITSKSPRVRRKRRSSRLFVPLVYLMFAGLFWTQKSIWSMAAFVLLSILWFFLYPIREKRRYVRLFRASIEENYKDINGSPGSIEFGNKQIIAKNKGEEARVDYSEVKGIVEIGDQFILKLKNGHSFIFPKAKITDCAALENILVKIAQQQQIPFEKELDWEWA